MQSRFERRLSWFLLISVCCALILSVTVYPFQVDLRAFFTGNSAAWPIRVLERLLNVVLFVPLGYVLASVGARRRLRAIVIAALLSAGIEFTQALLGTRNPGVFDVLANTLGAALGAMLTRWSLPAAGSWFWRGTFAVWIVAIALPMQQATRTLYLSGWDHRYDITIGDEFGGERRYRGQVDFGVICVGRGPDEECREIRGPTNVGRSLAERAEKSQQFRLIVTATAESREQPGPARLITWSQDYTHRNVMLGQLDRDGLLRVRTRGSTANGTAPSFRFPNAFEGIMPGDSFTASAVWDRGRITFSVRGSAWEYSREIALRSPRLLSLRTGPTLFVQPSHSGFQDQIAAAIVAFPTGFAAAGLGASLWLWIVTLPLVALAFLWAPTLLAGIPAPDILWTAPSFIVSAMLGWSLARKTIFSGTAFLKNR